MKLNETEYLRMAEERERIIKAMKGIEAQMDLFAEAATKATEEWVKLKAALEEIDLDPEVCNCGIAGSTIDESTDKCFICGK